MIVKIIVNDPFLGIRTVEMSFGWQMAKEEFIRNIMLEHGIWDDKRTYFYPYHKIDRIEFKPE